MSNRYEAALQRIIDLRSADTDGSRNFTRAVQIAREALGAAFGDDQLSAEIEAQAKIIYDAFTYDGVGEKPAWVPHGNSLKQDEARVEARRQLRLSLSEEARS